jgi:DNA-binding transcriptional regulator YiaG
MADAVGVASNTLARWERDELTMRKPAERLIRLLVQRQPTRRKAGK